jgi:large subunit ribosomal protein L25
MKEFRLQARPREGLGQAATKRLRREGYLPVNVYGHKQANRHVAVEYKALDRFIREGHRMLTLEVEDQSEHGVIKEIQYDALGTQMIHIDIARVDLEELITMSVPVVTIGVSKGQTAGGTLDISLKQIDIEGPANAIPEKIEIPIAELEIDQAIRIRDLAAPAKCRFDHEPDEVVLAVHPKRVAEELAAPAAPAPTEPEVISRRKEEPEEEGES